MTFPGGLLILLVARAAGCVETFRSMGQPAMATGARLVTLVSGHLAHILFVAFSAESCARARQHEGVRLMTTSASDPLVEGVIARRLMVAR
jgi:hypothetical protein